MKSMWLYIETYLFSIWGDLYDAHSFKIVQSNRVASNNLSLLNAFSKWNHKGQGSHNTLWKPNAYLANEPIKKSQRNETGCRSQDHRYNTKLFLLFPPSSSTLQADLKTTARSVKETWHYLSIQSFLPAGKSSPL